MLNTHLIWIAPAITAIMHCSCIHSELLAGNQQWGENPRKSEISGNSTRQSARNTKQSCNEADPGFPQVQ